MPRKERLRLKEWAGKYGQDALFSALLVDSTPSDTIGSVRLSMEVDDVRLSMGIVGGYKFNSKPVKMNGHEGVYHVQSMDEVKKRPYMTVEKINFPRSR